MKGKKRRPGKPQGMNYADVNISMQRLMAEEASCREIMYIE